MSAFNGSGTFVITGTGLPYVTGTTISSTVANQLNTDLATGLSTTITKDGQTTPTANIPMGGFKITGLGAATATGDALSAGTPIFAATRATSTQTVTSGTVTKVQLNTIRMDSGSYWDAVNFQYKPLIAGKYEVSGSVYCSGTTITSLVASISKNGTSGSGGTEVCEVVVVGDPTAANQSVNMPASFIAMNGSTDTLELDVTATGTGTLVVNSVRSTTQMSIRWVGP